MRTIVKTRPLNRFPGDTAVELVKRARDRNGVTWEAGTIFGCVLCCGIDNTMPGLNEYIQFTYGPGKTVLFYGPDRI